MLSTQYMGDGLRAVFTLRVTAPLQFRRDLLGVRGAPEPVGDHSFALWLCRIITYREQWRVPLVDLFVAL
jgi:hypothetical protein